MKMIKTINEFGTPYYEGVLPSTRMIDMEFTHVPETSKLFEEDKQIALHTNLGSLTVLDRMTGFGWRDVETGFRDTEGNFWLASGDCDVCLSGVLTIGAAIDWVKERANTCFPEDHEVAK